MNDVSTCNTSLLYRRTTSTKAVRLYRTRAEILDRGEVESIAVVLFHWKQNGEGYFFLIVAEGYFFLILAEGYFFLILTLPNFITKYFYWGLWVGITDTPLILWSLYILGN